MSREILRAENIVLGAKPKDKWEAIRMSGQILVDQGYVRPDYIEDMLRREKVASVYIGNGIAIPHGAEHCEENICESGISVLQVPDGVTFGEERAFVIIGIVGKANTHLEILSRIALICMEAQNVEAIKKARDVRTILEVLSGCTA